nr:MAG TPA: hypothetical protein [Caudoviricetes sp.]
MSTRQPLLIRFFSTSIKFTIPLPYRHDPNSQTKRQEASKTSFLSTSLRYKLRTSVS